MSKEYEAKPVEYTKNGLPVFTDQFQFYKQEKEKRREIAEEIKDIVNEEAIQIAVELYKNEFRQLGDAIERLERKVFPENFNDDD